MTRNPDKIISASRRSDIPAFYLDWFMDHIKRGVFTVKNPYNKTVKTVNASNDAIHSIVFWSKDYGAFIRTRTGEKLTQLGYNFVFNFTINSECGLLEPNLPPLEKRLDQLRELASRFGPEKISWRFDPICFYTKTGKDPLQNNLSDFPRIARSAETSGIKKCVTSFFDTYAKIQRRTNFLFQKNRPAVFFSDPPMDKQADIIRRMEHHLTGTRITLCLCCEKELFSVLGPDTKVVENSCIDGRALKTLFKGLPGLKRDYGQRAKKGCRCTRSIDIGSYDDHPCFHNCLFCYANPDIDNIIKQNLKSNEN